MKTQLSLELQSRKEVSRLFLKILIPVIALVALSNLVASFHNTPDYERMLIEGLILVSLIPTLILYKLRYEALAMYVSLFLMTSTLAYAVINNGGILAPAYIAILISIVFMHAIMPLWGTIAYYFSIVTLGAYAVFNGLSFDRSLMPSDGYYLVMYASYGAVLVAAQIVISKTLKRLLGENVERSSQLVAAINAINDPIFILDRESTLTHTNVAAVTFKTELEQLFRKDFFEIIWDRKGEGSTTLTHLVQSTIFTDLYQTPNEGSTEIELCLKVYQGYRWYVLSLTPYEMPNGIGAVIHIQDVTAHRKFMQAQKMNAVGQMASGIAHEFNNILSAIMGSVDLLQFDPREDQVELIEYVDEATQRASNLTKQLLMFTRKRPQFSKVVNLNDTVDNAATMLRGLLNKKIQHLVVRGLEAPTVQGDERLLTSAIMNLMINAAEAMPDGGLITVKTTVLHQAPNQENLHWHGSPLEDISYVSLEVSDHGVGISSQIIEHIFEPFFSTRDQSGAGIGLTAVYGAVSKHNGAIRVESIEGSGSTFQVLIPYLKHQEIKAENSIIPELSSLPKNLKILLVDDEEILRRTISRLLTNSGFQVTIASNGLEGVQTFQKDHFDLVILDMQMPVLSGLEALKLIKAVRSDIKVIIHSGYAKDEDLEQLANYGVTQVLSKPSRHQDLLKAITNEFNAK